MKKITSIIAVLLMAFTAVAADQAKPDIVIFLTDDQSQLDGAPYGQKDIRTPNMQRLAEAGLTFERAFVASPSCAPSRAALLTGLMPARNGAEWNQTKPRADIRKWPSYFQEAGYEVVAFGKVSHYKHTADYGFDHFAHDTFHDHAGIPAAVEFLQKRQGTKAKPLCLFVGSNWPHVPWPETADGYDPQQLSLPAGSIDTPATRAWRARYAAAVTKADEELGKIYDAARSSLGENTVFLFSSDHGAQWPFAKWNLYEAGIRVPLIVSWPGVVSPGQRTAAMVSWVDLLPTLLEAAGGKAPSGLDGRSFLPVLRENKTEHRDKIFTTHSGDGHFNLYPMRSVRTPRWKYISNLYSDLAFTTHIDLPVNLGQRAFFQTWEQAAKTNLLAAEILQRYHTRPHEELYDLEADPHEQNNLATEPRHQALLEKLRGDLKGWMREQGDKPTRPDQPRLLSDPSSYGPNALPEKAEAKAKAIRAVAALPKNEKPNVLFISTDDLNLNLGAYGHAEMKTPHLDKLAARGVKFDLAYCQYPLCNPSRASMFTGLRPNTTRVYDLGVNFRSTVPHAVTLPQLFRQNGYFTARVGKMFHYGVPREIGTSGKDDAISWDTVINPYGRDKMEESQLHILTRGTGSVTIGFAMAWLDMDGTDEEQTDGKTVNETIKLLEYVANTKKPFFIGAGFFRPHTPFVATKKWFASYPKDQIKLPEIPTDDLQDIPSIALHIRPQNYGLPESDLIDCVRAYRASVSCLDAQVGQLLAALDRLHLADNTIVVFFSDHGYLLGEHGQWQKQLLFDESARVPLIIYAPKAQGNGQNCPRPVELLDVYPTLQELCGLPNPPQKTEGKSLVPLLDKPEAKSTAPAFCQVTRPGGKGKPMIMGYSVRTERWRYTEWGRDGQHGRELYDHDNDPQELKNLVDTAGKAPVIAEMKKHLEKVVQAN